MALRKNEKRFIGLMVIPLVVVTVVAITVTALGHPNLGRAISNLGSALIFFGATGWIIIHDSKKKWPNANMSQRAANLLSFRR